MAFDGDQRAAPKFIAMLIEDHKHVFTDAARAHVVEPELDDAGQGGAALKEQLGEIKVLREHHRVVVMRPQHDVGVGGVSPMIS